jgi:pyruvate/2-oxoglutarate dehydrogenase complex dihydrolipoamide acyltransferase (E2) component
MTALETSGSRTDQSPESPGADSGTARSASAARISAFPRRRRHTLHFLAGITAFAPVFLDTEVDMTAVLAHRSAARESAAGRRYSLVTYVLHAASRAMVAHPAANSAISGRLRPRIARYPTASGKLAFDSLLDGERVVLSAVFPDLDRCDLDRIQDRLDRLRGADPAGTPEFAGAVRLDRLPVPLGRWASRAALRPLRRRPAVMGTFAVSSLGHRPVDGFHSVGGTTVTLGVGRVADRPVVRDGAVVAAPVMRLSLAFDHRVIDGAEAADLLGDVKDRLERFGPGDGVSGTGGAVSS